MEGVNLNGSLSEWIFKHPSIAIGTTILFTLNNFPELENYMFGNNKLAYLYLVGFNLEGYQLKH